MQVCFRLLSLLACLLLLGSTGCFRRWSMSEGEIRAHYAGRPTRPTFYTIENDSMRLHVASIGSDTLPPLLLIHGAPGAWYGYLQYCDDSLLQQRYHILAVDRPGYGKSRKGRRPVTSISQQAQFIAEALKLNRSGQPAVVLGRSFGAPIAARLAMLAPQRVHHLFMLAPPLDPEKEKFWWFSRWGRLGIVRLFLPRSLNTATDEKFSHIAELRRLEPLWPQLQTPATVMQGGQDWIVDPSNLDFAKRVLSGKPVEFIFLPKAGHLITNSHTSLVRELLLKTQPMSATLVAGSAQ